MKPVPSSFLDLLEGREVDSTLFDKTSLSGWAGLSQKTSVVLEDIAREISIRDVLRELAEPLREAQVRPLVLGGVSLWDQEYPQVGMRRVFDIDIWIPPSDFEACAQVLKAARFTQHPTFQMDWHRGPVEIDLHTHPINNDRGEAFDCLFTFDPIEIWQRALPLPCCPLEPWRRPAPEDHWIQMALHALKHEFERLNLVIDLHLLLQAHQPQTDLGCRLLAFVSPAIKALGVQVPQVTEAVPTLAYDVLKKRPQRPFLAGLRLLAALGKSPWRFWFKLALGNAAVRRESGVVKRWLRIFKRLK